MTTYQFTLTFDDGERIALEEALMLMIEQCDAELAAGADTHFWPNRRMCTEMLLSKLRTAPSEMTSTSSSCWPKTHK